MHFFSVKAQTWKSNPVSTPWNDPANWVEGVAPTVGSNVGINSCTVCPVLSSNVSVGSLAIGVGGGLNLQGFTLSSGATHLYFANIISTGGKLVAGSFNDIYKSTFTGALTLEKNGGGANSWGGGNIFNGPLTLILNVLVSEYNYIRTATKEPDAYNETVSLTNINGVGLNIGFNLTGSPLFGPSVFKKKVTFYSKTTGSGLGAVKCEGEVEVTSDLYGSITLGGSSAAKMNGEFKGPITANLLGTGKGNSVIFLDCLIHNQVTVNNTNAFANWGNIQVIFGNASHTPIFAPTASLRIGPNGFYGGELRLDRCVFQTTALTNLDLVTNTPVANRTGRLIIGTGTVFTGPVQATAPNIFLNIATYNQDATFIKTGGGANNSAGGNLFRKKLTITNQAGATSPMNLATQYDDLMQQ